MDSILFFFCTNIGTDCKCYYGVKGSERCKIRRNEDVDLGKHLFLFCRFCRSQLVKCPEYRSLCVWWECSSNIIFFIKHCYNGHLFPFKRTKVEMTRAPVQTHDTRFQTNPKLLWEILPLYSCRTW